VDPIRVLYESQRDNWAPKRIIRSWLMLGDVRSPCARAAS
jgi:hypothetical protein